VSAAVVLAELVALELGLLELGLDEELALDDELGLPEADVVAEPDVVEEPEALELGEAAPSPSTPARAIGDQNASTPRIRKLLASKLSAAARPPAKRIKKAPSSSCSFLLVRSALYSE
jgi:hypothetical protein